MKNIGQNRRDRLQDLLKQLTAAQRKALVIAGLVLLGSCFLILLLDILITHINT